MNHTTPGPWESIATPSDPDFTHEIANICAIYAGNGNSEANARLIAAAPELLEALKRSLNVLYATGAMDEAKAASDVIAKAEGRS